MRSAWIFILALMTAGVTPADGTLESWGFSQLMSLLGHVDHGLESDTSQHRSLSRHRRDVSTVSEYILDVEISIPDPSMASQIKWYLTNGLTFPMALGTGDTNITSIRVTTACNQTGSEVQCSCESGYLWSSDVCTSYTPCPGVSNCSCIKSPTFPTQFCQPQLVNLLLRLKLLIDFTSDLKDPNSANYKKTKTDLEAQFNKSYQALPGFKSVTITGFSPGSVIVDYTLVTEPTTTDALTAANNDVTTSLATTSYKAVSITTMVPGWSNISVSPNRIFVNDRVVLTCTVNVTTFSNVSWSFNGTETIQNNSYWSFTTSSFAGGIQSSLTINKASVEKSGIYQCNIEVNSLSHPAETTIQISTMDLTVLNSNVTCNGSGVPIIKCCTKEGTVTFNLTCQKANGNIVGISESSPLCQSYTISADPQSCSSQQTTAYSCTCATYYGALLTQNVAVSFQTPYQVDVTASSERISEWNNLTLTCKCNHTNVQTMTWEFSGDGITGRSINTNAYISNLATCSSVLTIPAANLSVNWNGMFTCKVDGANPANKTIPVYRIAKSSQITRFPITKGFTCNSAITAITPIDFSCCVDHIEAYQSDKTILEIYSGSNNLANVIMTFSDNCSKASYTPTSPCGSLTAYCKITNLIGDTVKSEIMTLNFVPNPQCTVSPSGLNIGVGEAGQNSSVSCRQINPNQDGNITYTCNGTQWVQSSDNCVSKVLNSLNNTVADLSTSPAPDLQVPSVVAKLNETLSQDQNITNAVGNIQLVVDILKQVGSFVKEVDTPVMKDFLNSVSIVVDNTTTPTWDKVPNKINESSSLLRSVESFAEKLNFSSTEISINNTNVQLIGNLVNNSNYNANFNFSALNNLTGNVFIDKTYLPHDTRVVSVGYATLKDIIGVPPNSTFHKTVNGLVMTTVLSNNKSTFSIAMDFKKSNSSLTDGSCVWWNFQTRDWDNTSCKLGNSSTNETVNCVCDHLTSFSILMSSSENISPENERILSYITYIGVGLSMFSLVVCIIIEAMIWKSVTKNKTSYMRHLCIMNIAVTLLMADIWFIIGAAMNTTDKVQACVAATFFAHLFYLCVFFWMLTMGLILFYRLMCVFHDLSKTIMMGISFFLGYGCPVIISVITVAVTKPRNAYLTSKNCWLNILESRAFLAFVIPAFTILLVNSVTLVVVIVKVLRPSVGDKPKKEEKSTLNHIAKCILILTPLLGLTWGLGIGTMVNQSIVIHGFFAALNSLQGLFILVFGCLMDKKVRDALFSRFSLSRWSSQQTKTSNLSSSDPVFARRGINLFAKKGVYNISSAQGNSSSEMTSSNSYSLLT